MQEAALELILAGLQLSIHATSLPPRLLRIWALELKAPVAFAPMTNGLCCTFFPHGGVIATGYVSVLNRWAVVSLAYTVTFFKRRKCLG